MKITALLFNPALLGMLALLASVLWMLADQKDRSRPLLVVALTANLFYGTALAIFLGKEGALLPFKYDVILLHVDSALGLSAASLARHLFGSRWNVAFVFIYYALLPAMILFYFIRKGPEQRGITLRAYAAELITGPMIYAVLPACGPRYALGQAWLHPLPSTVNLVRLAGMPNAFPSLHFATAFVFMLLAKRPTSRLIAALFLLGTGVATISTGEHYFVDLLPGLLFGSYAWAVGQRRWYPATFYLAFTLTWSLALRFGYLHLIAHPKALVLLALVTSLVATHSVLKAWKITWKRAYLNRVGPLCTHTIVRADLT